jgi:hypothetical protein
MRDLLEKALNKGLSVCFTSENGFDVIRISSVRRVASVASALPVSVASVEESLQALLLDLERKGF